MYKTTNKKFLLNYNKRVLNYYNWNKERKNVYWSIKKKGIHAILYEPMNEWMNERKNIIVITYKFKKKGVQHTVQYL